MNPLQLVLVGTVLKGRFFYSRFRRGGGRYLQSPPVGHSRMFILGAAWLMEGLLHCSGPFSWRRSCAVSGRRFSAARWTPGWPMSRRRERRTGLPPRRAGQSRRRSDRHALSVALASIALNIPMLVGGGIYLALGVLLVCAMPEHGFHPTPRGERASWRAMADTLRAGAGAVRHSPSAHHPRHRLLRRRGQRGLRPALGGPLPEGFLLPSARRAATRRLVRHPQRRDQSAGMLFTFLLQRRLDAISRVPAANARALLCSTRSASLPSSRSVWPETSPCLRRVHQSSA